MTVPTEPVKQQDSKYAIRVLQAFRRIIREMDLHSKKLASSYRVTGPQLVCLQAVVESGQLSVSDIAHRVYLSASTVVGILDRLEDKKLVIRERNREDRRQVDIRPTDLGREVAAAAPSPLQERLAGALYDLPELEQATIAMSLERIVQLMETHRLLPDEDTMLSESSITPEI